MFIHMLIYTDKLFRQHGAVAKVLMPMTLRE